MSRIRLLLLTTALVSPAAAASAASFDITTGTNTTAQTLAGAETGAVRAGATLAPNGLAINSSAAATGVVITNAGTIAPTGGNRAIDITGAAARTITINNNAGGVITATSDTIRLNSAPTSGAIIINNAGTISNTGGGQQALDLRGGTNAGLITQVNNLAGGVISSNSEDAIRGAQGTVITNAGTIQSTTTLNAYGKFDGIDWGGNVGTVVNQTGGLISGVRHGITADTNLNVTNEAGGVIIGNNGSGVGSDGTGTVVNRGTITGAASDQYTPSVTDGGDGDGVDIDGVASITNYGTIQGLGAYGIKDGQANASEGIAMGGGVIDNIGSASVIRGFGNGILVDDGNDGPGVANTTLTNAGTIEGLHGAAVKLVGNFNDTVTNTGTIRSTGGPALSLGDGADSVINSGIITATGGSAIDFGAGNDALTLKTGSAITGVVDGGAGTDTVNLQLGGAFAGGVNFETLDVQSGVWTLTGAQTYGATTVRSGATAVVNGTLSGPLTVASGGRLGGSGTVGALTVNGTIAPGNSIGTTSVGSVNFAAGSTYEVEVDNAGHSDLIAASGTAALNGAVVVQPAAGTYANINTYTILTAAGGRTGTFTGVTSASAFLTPELGYTANAVTLTLRRNNVQFSDVATNRSQSGAGGVITAAGFANPLYQALLPLSAADARSGLQTLSGDLFPSITSVLIEDSARARGAIASRLGSADAGVWINTFTESGSRDAHDGLADVDEDQTGMIMGADRAAGAWRAGASVGMSTGSVDLTGRRAEGKFDGQNFNAYLGGDVGPVNIRAGLGWTRYQVTTGRAVVVGALNQTLASSFDASGGQLFGEASLAVGALQPFVGLAWSNLQVDAFTETGGSAALKGAKQDPDISYATLGVRYQAEVATGVVHGSLAWRDALSEASSSVMQFASGGSAFVVDGGAPARSVVLLDLGGDFKLGESATLSVGVDGQLGSDTSRLGANVGLNWRF